jgi:DHA1 family tetracycline resistance protein-like MFS transporter
MSAAPARSRAALAFILVTILLDALGIGLVIPVVPSLIEGFTGGDTQQAAHVIGLFGSAYALMQFAFMPLAGALSDRFGRRPVVLISNLGMGLDYLLMAAAPGLAWLFAGRLLAGVTAASLGTANAYIADVTPPEKRAAAFGFVGATFGIGFVIGPALGGLLGSFDVHLPFVVAACLSLANFVYGVFVLPESLPAARRAPFTWRAANPFGALTLLRRHRRLLPLALVLFLSALAHVALPAVFVLYAGWRFGWSPLDVGLLLAFVGVSSVVVQGGLIRRVVAAIGERRALLVGLAMGAVAFVGYGFAPTAAWMVWCVPVMSLWGLASPTAQSFATAQVGADEQGRLQGALASVTALAEIGGPVLFAVVFARTTGADAWLEMPGAAFYVAAMLLGLACVVALGATRGMARVRPVTSAGGGSTASASVAEGAP